MDLSFYYTIPINIVPLSKKEIAISLKTEVRFYLNKEEGKRIDIKEKGLDMILLEEKSLSIPTNEGNIKSIKKDKDDYYIYTK